MQIVFPKYFRIMVLLVATIALGYLLVLGKSILTPIALSYLFALLMLPVCEQLEKWRFPRWLAIISCLLILVIILSGLVFFISTQMDDLAREIPVITTRLQALVDDLRHYVEDRLRVNSQEQLQYVKEGIINVAQSSGSLLSSTAGATGSVLAALGLMPIYIFFFLFYREFFAEFAYRLFANRYHDTVAKVLRRIRELVQSYLSGLVIVILIVSVLNTVGLLVIGIGNAFFFGILAGLLIVIPYIGVFVGSLLPTVYALVTKDSGWYAVAVIGWFALVQSLEGNFITPNIVGSKVSLNPLAAIVALLVGAALWGTVGMVLSVPFIAIFKVIFDAVPGLEPIGFLLGEPPNRLRS